MIGMWLFIIIKFGIPYMGSKRNIAEKLIKKMLDYKPRTKYFYDFFGGGGAMSFMALQHGLKVYYNEYDSELSNFMKFTIDRIKNKESSKFGLYPEEFYQFVTKKMFIENKDKSGIYPEFVRLIYSFGNNKKAYMFGKDKEKWKHLLHDVIIFESEKKLKELKEYMPDFSFIKGMPKADTWNERRLIIKSWWNNEIKNNKGYKKMVETRDIRNYRDLTYKKLDRKIKSITDLEQLESLQKLGYLQQLEQLQQLERLEKLQQLDNFNITNLSYEQVSIDTDIDKTIIYCDPPYRNTTKYISGCFDYKKFDNWVKDNKHFVFISEYNTPFKDIMTITKQSLLNNNAEKKKVVKEKLYINKDIESVFKNYFNVELF